MIIIILVIMVALIIRPLIIISSAIIRTHLVLNPFVRKYFIIVLVVTFCNERTNILRTANFNNRIFDKDL